MYKLIKEVTCRFEGGSMKSKWDKFSEKKVENERKFYALTDNLEELSSESKRVSDVAKNVNIITSNLEQQFMSATKLTSFDMKFLITAIVMQCVRQYVLQPKLKLDNEGREGNQKTAKRIKKVENGLGIDEGSGVGRGEDLLHPTLTEILGNPVPFDTSNNNTDVLGDDFTFKGSHRTATLGHDPVLGWIFGSANIATRTVTMWNFHTASVEYGQYGGSKNPDYFSSSVSTWDVLKKYYLEDLPNMMSMPVDVVSGEFSQVDNDLIFPAAVAMEGFHLASDVTSKNGLPLPVLSTISPKFASDLGKYGLDTYGLFQNLGVITQQAAMAQAINVLVAMVHRLYKDDTSDMSLKLYQVRTQKIITYSNAIAAGSNVIGVAIWAALNAENPGGVKKSLEYLDIGGILVAIYQIVKNDKLQQEIFEEFISNGWYDIVMEG